MTESTEVRCTCDGDICYDDCGACDEDWCAYVEPPPTLRLRLWRRLRSRWVRRLVLRTPLRP